MKIHGFTLFELIITIALAAILLGLAVPNLSDFFQDNRMAGQTNAFITALNHARSEALKRNRVVHLCASSTGTACDTGSADWSRNRVVLDPDPGVHDLERVIRVFDGSATAGNFLVRKNPVNSDPIAFLGSGALDTSVTTSSASPGCDNSVCFDICQRSSPDSSQCAVPRCRAGKDLRFRTVRVSQTGSIVADYRPCP